LLEGSIPVILQHGFRVPFLIEKRITLAMSDFSFMVEFPGFSKEGESLLKSSAIKEGLTVTKYG
jgi:hypothetical protein